MEHQKPHTAHSSEYFGEERDFFWNRDYLNLLGQRLDLKRIRSVADIGCGIGHWTSSLCSQLNHEAEIIGIDQEYDSVELYKSRMSEQFPGRNISGREADAYSLPIPDRSVDLATCQTLLIHLADPSAAITEMKRITRDNGLVLCAEPNNLIGRFPSSWFLRDGNIEVMARLTQMVWCYALGREKRGLGREWLGEVLPGLFHEAGLTDIRVWLCDRTLAMYPPYATEEQRTSLASADKWRSEGIGPFDKGAAQANVLAGGGSDEFFELAWADYIEQDRRMIEAIRDGQWYSSGGGLFYVVAGTVREHR